MEEKDADKKKTVPRKAPGDGKNPDSSDQMISQQRAKKTSKNALPTPTLFSTTQKDHLTFFSVFS
ncbi:hypothetical protein [Dictyobacter formicarum]|uniref:Uncharacterized protein n=1 Tax=Dictyobacter formicarum TaxID=2778368 RepID=A0ABQ3VIC6_9CHLR|nr:hypothetical protein [Dictyobacter formicarum]GHO85657.1 hypothetical protein KSZ_36630 [Dictyobacter formicarum]